MPTRQVFSPARPRIFSNSALVESGKDAGCFPLRPSFLDLAGRGNIIHGDHNRPRLIVLGATGVVASLLVLVRVSWLRAGRVPATGLAEVP